MLQLQTPLDIPPAPFALSPGEEILLVGSCFASNMAERLAADKFRVTANPFGVMYNPHSILHTLQRVEAQPHTVVLTLGTTHIYILRSTGEVVDNCQKRPASLFREETMTLDDTTLMLARCADTVRERWPEARIVVTVSPIRYRKYGFHESRLAKATLLLAADQICRTRPLVYYFPAYELMDDELRDYRFYTPDMLHPSAQAADYIYQRFGEACFSAETCAFLAEWRPLRQALAHRPLHAESEEYQRFIEKTRQQVHALSAKYGNFVI